MVEGGGGGRGSDGWGGGGVGGTSERGGGRDGGRDGADDARDGGGSNDRSVEAAWFTRFPLYVAAHNCIRRGRKEGGDEGRRKSQERLRALYREMLVLEDAAEVDRQIDAGVCIRLVGDAAAGVAGGMGGDRGGEGGRKK